MYLICCTTAVSYADRLLHNERLSAISSEIPVGLSRDGRLKRGLMCIASIRIEPLLFLHTTQLNHVDCAFYIVHCEHSKHLEWWSQVWRGGHFAILKLKYPRLFILSKPAWVCTIENTELFIANSHHHRKLKYVDTNGKLVIF